MAWAISDFTIENLHGRQTIIAPFAGNKLLLVGENGLGKSTFAKLMFYFLSCQWGRLAEYEFSSIRATINGELLEVNQEMLAAIKQNRMSPGRLLSEVARSKPYVWRELSRLDLSDVKDLIDGRADPRLFARRLNIPPDQLMEMIYEQYPWPDALKIITNKLRSGHPAIIFLPTYRRIEQDLKRIFPRLEIDTATARGSRVAYDSDYIELVEFGMEDVEETVKARLVLLKDHLRTGLTNLIGTYLRDVIRGKHEEVDTTVLQNLSPGTASLILDRIDENTLPRPDKQRLQKIVLEIRDNHAIDNTQKVAAHFLLKLVELNSAQVAAESRISEFVRVCNNYLGNKQLLFDNTNFTLSIQDKKSPRAGELSFSMLSSGEKQIVSLFAYIYLIATRRVFVIIDEPELSLSVKWQQRFLPDVLSTDLCAGLLAVTHSPFIFDNALDRFTRSFSEFSTHHQFSKPKSDLSDSRNAGRQHKKRRFCGRCGAIEPEPGSLCGRFPEHVMGEI